VVNPVPCPLYYCEGKKVCKVRQKILNKDKGMIKVSCGIKL